MLQSAEKENVEQKPVKKAIDQQQAIDGVTEGDKVP
jgi:hypothetical protein